MTPLARLTCQLADTVPQGFSGPHPCDWRAQVAAIRASQERCRAIADGIEATLDRKDAA